MRKVSVVLLFIHSLLFSKPSLVNNINFVPYINESHVGIQINPSLTGIKGNILNQEMDLNLVLYYHDKYTLKDDQVLGHLEGRLISEIPLSSFNLNDRIKNDTSLELSNFAENFSTYAEALKIYQEVLNKMVDTPNANQDEEIEYYENPEEYDENLEEYDENIEEYTPYTDSEETNVYTLYNNKLQYIPNTFVANMTTNNGYSSISKEELELLIKLEKLKKAYQKDQLEENKKMQYKDQFDPADPAERFTIVFFGDNGVPVWSKSFGLNGKDTYQSYNSKVWYLGYKIMLTKKDLRILHKLFSSNKNISYFVKGSQTTVDFKLSLYLITAIQELIDVYVRGGFALDDTSKFPMMSNLDDYLQ